MQRQRVETSELRIHTEAGGLPADLARPEGFHALVLFAQARGRARHSAGERQLAERLRQHGVATLLPDLLTTAEQQDPGHPVDLPLLTERLQQACAWLDDQAPLRHALLGLCGAGMGSAAVLIAAARLGRRVGAVVSVGGRPDLAGAAALAAVKAPTLLLAGSADPAGIAHSDAAYQQLRCERSLAAVPAARELMGAHGACAHAAEIAADWFAAHLVPAPEYA